MLIFFTVALMSQPVLANRICESLKKYDRRMLSKNIAPGDFVAADFSYVIKPVTDMGRKTHRVRVIVNPGHTFQTFEIDLESDFNFYSLRVSPNQKKMYGLKGNHISEWDLQTGARRDISVVNVILLKTLAEVDKAPNPAATRTALSSLKDARNLRFLNTRYLNDGRIYIDGTLEILPQTNINFRVVVDSAKLSTLSEHQSLYQAAMDVSSSQSTSNLNFILNNQNMPALQIPPNGVHIGYENRARAPPLGLRETSNMLQVPKNREGVLGGEAFVHTRIADQIFVQALVNGKLVTLRDSISLEDGRTQRPQAFQYPERDGYHFTVSPDKRLVLGTLFENRSGAAGATPQIKVWDSLTGALIGDVDVGSFIGYTHNVTETEYYVTTQYFEPDTQSLVIQGITKIEGESRNVSVRLRLDSVTELRRASIDLLSPDPQKKERARESIYNLLSNADFPFKPNKVFEFEPIIKH